MLHEFNAGRGGKIKKIMGAEGIPLDEFFWFFSDISVMLVQYGNREMMCDTLNELGDDYERVLE